MFVPGTPRNWSTLKKIVWMKRMTGGGGGGEITTVTGISPLVLANGLHKPIHSLKQYGLCTQASTPTPDAPVDIMCNNGALRYGAVGKNLVNITAADIEQGAISSADGSNSGSASHRVRTIGYYPVKPNTQYTISCVIDGYTSGSSKGVFILEYSSDSVSGYTGDSSGWKSPSGYAFTTGATTNFIRIVFAKGSSTSTPTIPTDISNIQLEYGDTATEYEPFVGGIYTDGTDEVLTVLANQNTDPTIIKATLASGTTEVRYNASSSCIVAPVKPNTVYTIGFLEKPTGGSIFRVATTKTKVSSSVTSAASIAYDLEKNDYEPKTLNSGAEAAWMYVQLSNTMSDDDFASILIQEGTSLTPSQTVTNLPTLLSVGDAKDELELISGIKTGKVGVKVLDGTEDGWSQATTTQGVLRFYLPFDGAATPTGARAQVASTHFAYAAQEQDPGIAFLSVQTRVYFIPTDQTMTDTTWKAWLASEYANGTPVIVLYPLATETTEQGTPHSLHTSEGDNMVDVTANVSPVELEVEYVAAAAGG